MDDRKNTSGGCFYIENCLASWMSKKQNFVSLSTAEVECIVGLLLSTSMDQENIEKLWN